MAIFQWAYSDEPRAVCPKPTVLQRGKNVKDQKIQPVKSTVQWSDSIDSFDKPSDLVTAGQSSAYVSRRLDGWSRGPPEHNKTVSSSFRVHLEFISSVHFNWTPIGRPRKFCPKIGAFWWRTLTSGHWRAITEEWGATTDEWTLTNGDAVSSLW